jgi:hypothetical protein
MRHRLRAQRLDQAEGEGQAGGVERDMLGPDTDDDGAAIGAGAGAAAGTGTAMMTRGDPAVIPAESVLTFKLSAPVTVPLK